jgi:oligopeptide transport system ATP-binding protein
MSESAVDVRELTVRYPVRSGIFGRATSHVQAVDRVSLRIPKGQTLGLVGESGCGKTTLGMALLRLVQPTAGSVRINGIDVTTLKPGALRAARRHMQVVFQDPYASLSARKTIGRSVGEPLTAHGIGSRPERRRRVLELLERVGLPRSAADRYPHELSGGQRQRVAIARALVLEPAFIVCDEPTSSLDVSVQAQVVNLLLDLQRELELTYLFISHDLGLVKHVSDTIGVMHLGRLVELGTPQQLVSSPKHPYTAALLSAVPTADLDELGRSRIVLQGELPDPRNPPSGCGFRLRCWRAFEPCPAHDPELRELEPQQWVACHLHAGNGATR